MKTILINEYYKNNNLISIEIATSIESKLEEHKDFNIYKSTMEEMKAKAYDYLIEKLNAGYMVQDIQKLIIKNTNWYKHLGAIYTPLLPPATTPPALRKNIAENIKPLK